MLFGDRLVVMRGGGDLGTGVAYRLHRAGFPIIVLELGAPLTIRRTVAFSTAVTDDSITVDGVTAQRVASVDEALVTAQKGRVAVAVSDTLAEFPVPASVVVDARLAKRNLDTSIDDAPLVIGLGPGFVAGGDCHAVVETMRGHQLGRVLWEGAAAADTGVPGLVGGRSSERVVRAGRAGRLEWSVEIGQAVAAGQVMGTVGAIPVEAGIDGVVRGLLADGRTVEPGLKIADIDPRTDRRACFEISDKALAIGGGVVEAVFTWLNR